MSVTVCRKGHSSIIHEVKTQLGGVVPGCLVVCVGGGGLLSGWFFNVNVYSSNCHS